MPKRFTATQNAIEKGLADTKPAAGAKLVTDWEKELDGLDLPGAKGIAGDLERLRKELEKDEPGSPAVERLIGKLGAATTKIADRADEAVAEKLRELGKALSEAGDEGDDKD